MKEEKSEKKEGRKRRQEEGWKEGAIFMKT